MPLTRLVRVCACIHLWLSALWGRVAEWFSMQRCMGNEPVPHTHQKGQKTQNAQNETSGTTTEQQNNKIACMLLFFTGTFRFLCLFCCEYRGLHIIIRVWLFLLAPPYRQPFRSRFLLPAFRISVWHEIYSRLSFLCVSQSHAVKITYVHICLPMCVCVCVCTRNNTSKNLIWICTSNSHINF